MPVESLNYKCPNCSAPLAFNPDTGILGCDHCGSTFTLDEIKEVYDDKYQKAEVIASEKKSGHDSKTINGGQDFSSGASEFVNEELIDDAKRFTSVAQDPIHAFLQRASWNESERAGMRAYVCQSCGASLTVDATTAVQECPYCSSQSVIPGVFSDDARPDSLIPFGVTRQQAINELASYYRGKKFLPRAFASDNKISHVQGVYVPFWLYDGIVSGNGTFNATRVNTMSQGDYMITVTRYYRAERSGNIAMRRVPADGSAKMPNGHMDAIEPYDYSKLRPFEIEYLPGFVAERYDENADECKPRADARMKQTFTNELRSTVTGYDTVDYGTVSSSAECTRVEHAMLPVWMLHTKWNDDDYLFAMNGQTGKMVGDLPVSVPKAILWFIGLFIMFSAIMLGLDVSFLQFDETWERIVFDGIVPIAASGGTCYSFYRQMKTARIKHEASGYVTAGGLKLTMKRDTFVTETVTRTKISQDNPQN